MYKRQVSARVVGASARNPAIATVLARALELAARADGPLRSVPARVAAELLAGSGPLTDAAVALPADAVAILPALVGAIDRPTDECAHDGDGRSSAVAGQRGDGGGNASAVRAAGSRLAAAGGAAPAVRGGAPLAVYPPAAGSRGPHTTRGFAHLPASLSGRLSDGLLAGGWLRAYAGPLPSAADRTAGSAAEHGGGAVWTVEPLLSAEERAALAAWVRGARASARNTVGADEARRRDADDSDGAGGALAARLFAQLRPDGTLAVSAGAHPFDASARELYVLRPPPSFSPVQPASGETAVLALARNGTLVVRALAPCVSRANRREPACIGAPNRTWTLAASALHDRSGARALAGAGVQACLTHTLVLRAHDGLLALHCAELAADGGEVVPGELAWLHADARADVDGATAAAPAPAGRLVSRWTGIADESALLADGVLHSAGADARTLRSAGGHAVLSLSRDGQLCSYPAAEFARSCAGDGAHATTCAPPLVCVPREPSKRGAYHARLGDGLAWPSAMAEGARWAPRLCVRVGASFAQPREPVWCAPDVCIDGSRPPCARAHGALRLSACGRFSRAELRAGSALSLIHI